MEIICWAVFSTILSKPVEKYNIKIFYVQQFDSDDRHQMIYTLIISLLIEKPFYLLRPQSFSFQIVSKFMDIFVKFSNFMSGGGAFDSLFCPEGRVFVHNDCPRGERFCSLQVVSWGFVPGGWFWMKLIPALHKHNNDK